MDGRRTAGGSMYKAGGVPEMDEIWRRLSDTNHRQHMIVSITRLDGFEPGFHHHPPSSSEPQRISGYIWGVTCV
jgi:hypothetical protein